MQLACIQIKGKLMKKQPHENSQGQSEVRACDESLTRKEFIRKVVTRSVVAGTLVVGARISDKFLVPPAFAAASQGIVTNPQLDTDPFADN